MLPFYLHRVWTGQAASAHIYFTTNEQHAKVFRVSKQDFCPAGCMMFGYGSSTLFSLPPFPLFTLPLFYSTLPASSLSFFNNV